MGVHIHIQIRHLTWQRPNLKGICSAFFYLRHAVGTPGFFLLAMKEALLPADIVTVADFIQAPMWDTL